MADDGPAGALGELVRRWGSGEAAPERGQATARPLLPAPGVRDTAGMAGEPPGPIGPGPLDALEQALEVLLRREAEQHGLDGRPS